ncbi:MAG: ABC transporter substrate-binding protein [Phycisphaerales bacterium]|nr:ABC transporter substrate-binding protein [Phycisphaerales bacterium]
MTDPRPVIRLGYSPDPDDAFMWWPLFEHEGRPPVLSSDRVRFEPVLIDIETANRRAEGGEDLLEITALSCGHYPRVADRYAITACGSSMGDGYGPKLVGRVSESLEQLAQRQPRIAIPGARTTASLVLSMMLGPDHFEAIELPFKEIPERVMAGEADAGVVIHEGQLTFEDTGLVLLEDLGAWWTGRTGLPLPLGVNAVRRDLDEVYGPGTLTEIARMLEASIAHALANREEAIGHALAHARGMETELAGDFVDLYVNDLTVDVGEEGFAAVKRLLTEAAEAGLLPAVSLETPLKGEA